MADGKDFLDFLEGRVRVLLDVNLEFLRVEFPPVPPTGFGCQRPRLPGGQIAVNCAPTKVKASGRLDFGTAVFDELHHSLPQIQRISFHANKPIPLCANFNMKCYRPSHTALVAGRLRLHQRF